MPVVESGYLQVSWNICEFIYYITEVTLVYCIQNRRNRHLWGHWYGICLIVELIVAFFKCYRSYTLWISLNWRWWLFIIQQNHLHGFGSLCACIGLSSDAFNQNWKLYSTQIITLLKHWYIIACSTSLLNQRCFADIIFRWISSNHSLTMGDTRLQYFEMQHTYIAHAIQL